jgi:hypothetical protein
VATWTDVDSIIGGLDHVTQGARYGQSTWFVNGRAFAWDRPYSKADLKRFGTEPPPASEPILALATADLHEKEAILASGITGVFTISHFDGYAAILVELSAIGKRSLRTLVTDAYRSQVDRGRS